ncbi:MAG: monovalent cation/H(+) antiporter subunit G [Dermatophilus congolensis]|nr:monovalent cation/H(+) antiporter subunit G [Dermatophilus congolensis]
MTWGEIADVLGMLCLVAGAILCLAAAIGILRLPDFLSRMHAATKPQVLGVLLVLLAVALRLRPGWEVTMLVLVGIFQMFTVPASGQMLSRAYHRRFTAQARPAVPSRANDPQADPLTDRHSDRRENT